MTVDESSALSSWPRHDGHILRHDLTRRRRAGEAGARPQRKEETHMDARWKGLVRHQDELRSEPSLPPNRTTSRSAVLSVGGDGRNCQHDCNDREM